MRSHLSLTAILGIPLVLLGLSLTGLVGALLFDGAWDLAFAGMVCLLIAYWDKLAAGACSVKQSVAAKCKRRGKCSEFDDYDDELLYEQ